MASNHLDHSEGDDLFRESLLTFAQAARRLPTNRAGKPVHGNTLLRWAIRGLRGPGGEIVKLEYFKIGARRNCTSEEALMRFFSRLKGDERVVVLPAKQRRRAMQTEEELKRLGF